MVGLSELTVPTYELVIQTLTTVGLLFGIVEWRFRSLNSCIKRVDGRIDNHLENNVDRKTAL